LDSTDIGSLQRWLASRGSSVLGMDLTQPTGVITTLPCPKLQCLVLQNCDVDLRPGSQLLQDLCSATALTTLCFGDVTYQGEPDLAAVLLALPNLKWFGLCNLGEVGYIKVQQSPQEQLLLHTRMASEDQDSYAPSLQLWSAHGHPTDGCRCFTDSGMQTICMLTKLQLLDLSTLQGVTAAGLARLADLTGLNHLLLEDLTCDINSPVPAFSQLTDLTWLALSWVKDTTHREFDPYILAHMTQLKALRINDGTPARGQPGAAELLSGLSQLPELRTLFLCCIGALQQCPPEAMSSMTSSGLLESLTWETWTPFG